MTSTETIGDEIGRLLSDDVIREIAGRHFNGMTFDNIKLAEGCRDAGVALRQFQPDSKVRSEIKTLYKLCNSALVSTSFDSKAQLVALHYDAMSETAKRWLARRLNGNQRLEALRLRSRSPEEQRASIEDLRSLTVIGGSIVPDRKRPGRPAGRERSNKLAPILNAPTTKRGQQPPEDIWEFVMWMRIAYVDAFGEPLRFKADNRTPGGFVHFMEDVLEVLGGRNADLVRATNHLANLRSRAEEKDEN